MSLESVKGASTEYWTNAVALLKTEIKLINSVRKRATTTKEILDREIAIRQKVLDFTVSLLREEGILKAPNRRK